MEVTWIHFSWTGAFQGKRILIWTGRGMRVGCGGRVEGVRECCYLSEISKCVKFAVYFQRIFSLLFFRRSLKIPFSLFPFRLIISQCTVHCKDLRPLPLRFWGSRIGLNWSAPRLFFINFGKFLTISIPKFSVSNGRVAKCSSPTKRGRSKILFSNA